MSRLPRPDVDLHQAVRNVANDDPDSTEGKVAAALAKALGGTCILMPLDHDYVMSEITAFAENHDLARHSLRVESQSMLRQIFVVSLAAYARTLRKNGRRVA